MSKENRKKLKKRTVALLIAAVFIGALLVTLLSFYLSFVVSDANAHTWVPDYDMLSEEELKAIYYKGELTDEDYQTLFEQTGLTKIGIDRAKEVSTGWDRVKSIQEEYFAERTVDKQLFAPLVCNDRTKRPATAIYLRRGDIIVSASTHFAGFRIGHAAVVTNAGAGIIFEATQVGSASQYSNISSITDRINFMILRINPEYFGGDDDAYTDNLDRVTGYIENDLKDAEYSVFTGVFTNKNKIKYTMCSHLIWYAYRHFDDENGGKYSLDLDSNGGLLVMPKDISKSPYVQIIQTFGFDPDYMYK